MRSNFFTLKIEAYCPFCNFYDLFSLEDIQKMNLFATPCGPTGEMFDHACSECGKKYAVVVDWSLKTYEFATDQEIEEIENGK